MRQGLAALAALAVATGYARPPDEEPSEAELERRAAEKAARDERVAAYNRKVEAQRAEKLERDRPVIEAAEAKRARRAAKRLRIQKGAPQ